MASTVTGVDEAKAAIKQFVEEELVFLQDTYASQVRSRTPIKSGQARRGWQKRKAGLDRIVENRVPYIGRLENGYSHQAPDGFVKQAKTATLNTKRKT